MKVAHGPYWWLVPHNWAHWKVLGPFTEIPWTLYSLRFPWPNSQHLKNLPNVCTEIGSHQQGRCKGESTKKYFFEELLSGYYQSYHHSGPRKRLHLKIAPCTGPRTMSKVQIWPQQKWAHAPVYDLFTQQGVLLGELQRTLRSLCTCVHGWQALVPVGDTCPQRYKLAACRGNPLSVAAQAAILCYSFLRFAQGDQCMRNSFILAVCYGTSNRSIRTLVWETICLWAVQDPFSQSMLFLYFLWRIHVHQRNIFL